MMRSSRSDCSGKRLVFGIVQIVVQPRRGGGVDGTSVLTCLDKYSVNRENPSMPTATMLTPRQAAFIPAFLACGNATASAIDAGFSVKGASVAGTRMLRNAKVQEALQARQIADATRLSVKRESVLAGLLEAVEMARGQQDPMGMVRGLAELGHMMGFYSPRHTKVAVAPVGLGDTGQYSAMSDRQLLALIANGGPVEAPGSSL